MPLNNLLQLGQAAVEEMTGTGKNDHGQRLGSGPVEYFAERRDVVFLSMDDERIGRHIAHRKAANSRRRQHQMPGLQPLHYRRRDKCPERKSADCQLAFAIGTLPIVSERQKIIDFTASLIEYAATGTHAAEIKS